MSYQIYGYVQIKKENYWITAPVYHKKSNGDFEPVILWHGREVGQYLWQKSTLVTEEEATNFMREMDYLEKDEEACALESVKAISLAYMKYIALTFDPDHNDYDYGGDEDCIKPGIEQMIKQIEAVVEFAEFYGNLDEIRYIFHESC